MANTLMDLLKKKDKAGIFEKTQTVPSYSTGFINLDYYNGYILDVFDEDDNIVDSNVLTGIVGGSFVTIIGKSGVAKSTAAIQFGSNIVRPFESGFVQHFDLEQAMNYTRIKHVSQFTMKELKDKYILKQEKSTIEDIYDSCESIWKTKMENKSMFQYDTGLRNEFGEPIIAMQPTVVIADSIPTMSTKDAGEGMEGGTYANRVAKAIAQFYKRMTPIIKEANIIFIAINHINQKIEINPRLKTQPQLLYMKMDESMPGGNAPIYYANNVFKFVTKGKYEKAEDGFDGFRVRCEFLKSRTNKAGKSTYLVYNQEIGFDPIYTQLEIAQENELLTSKNPYRRFVGNEDVKFSTKKFRKEFIERDEVRKALFKATIPFLEKQLSTGLKDNDGVQTDETNFEVMKAVLESYNSDDSFDDRKTA